MQRVAHCVCPAAGAWEYPPPRDDSQGLSPSLRSHSTDVYVPTNASDKGARPGSLGTGAASSKLPASFWARYAANYEPIMEAAREGSIDTDSQPSGELPLPLTPHNSLNEEATSGTQSGNGSADVAPGNNSQPSGQPQRGGAGSGAAGKRRSKKKPAPLVLETRNSFTITAEVPVSPFSNDPEGRLLSNGWEPSWPVQLPAGERDSSEAYCRIFCSDKGRKSARPLSLRSDSATAADSPFGSRASSRGYFADSEKDADSTRGDDSRASSSTAFGGCSPFAGSEPGSGGLPERRHSERSPFSDPDEDAETSGSGLGRRHSDRAPFADPDPGALEGMGLFTRRDSQMGFPGLDEDFSNGNTPELPSASPSLSSPFSSRSAAPSPFANPEVQLKGDTRSQSESSASITSPFTAQRQSSSNGEITGQNGAAGQSHAVPNGVLGNGAANGGDLERRASGRGRADSANMPPTGVNKTTGNAVFWAGSKSLGISFVDEPEEAAPAPGPARFTNGDMHLPGGAEMSDSSAEDPAFGEGLSEEPSELGADGRPANALPQRAAAAGSPQETAAESAPGLGSSAAADAVERAEGAENGEEPSGAAGNESAADLEAELGAGWKAQSLPSPRATAAAAAAAADAEAGPALPRRLSKGILRKSVAAISIKREAVKGYLIHRCLFWSLPGDNLEISARQP